MGHGQGRHESYVGFPYVFHQARHDGAWDCAFRRRLGGADRRRGGGGGGGGGGDNCVHVQEQRASVLHGGVLYSLTDDKHRQHWPTR